MGTCGNTQVIPGSKNADANCDEWNNVAVEAGGGGGGVRPGDCVIST